MTSPVVVITGASRGLGRAIALRCAAAHWRVAITYRNRRDDAEAVLHEIVARGGEAMLWEGDVSDAGSAADTAARTVERWGRIDAWVNNAAIVDDRVVAGMPDDAWDRVISVDLSSPARAIRAVAPAMIRQGGGAILNVASIVGVEGRRGQSNYGAAKAGLLGLTRAAAHELGPHGIRVNAVCPPVMPTDTAGRHVAALRVRRLLPAEIDPAEVATAIVAVLALPWITGHTFMLDSRIPEGG